MNPGFVFLCPMTILYFTTTGNSLAVAKAIGGRLKSIPAMLLHGETTVSDDDAIGIVCPVHFGQVPEQVARFLFGAELNAPYIFCIMTCGSTPALAAKHLLKIRSFDYIASIEMVDNYFPFFDVARQVADLPRKQVESHLGNIICDIAVRNRKIERSGIYGHIAGWYMRVFPLSKTAYRRFYITPGLCTGCGVCTRVCPIANITLSSEGLPVIADKCLTCGACYHNCPSKAIRYRGEKSSYSYRHPDVSLHEIIDSNNQTEQ